jgi:hypothetical protein
MFLAYVDETGDTGSLTKQGASACYGLGCVLIKHETWAKTYDDVVGFRRMLRDSVGINVRAEIKANYLIRNTGPLRKLSLSPQQRRWVYREHFRLLHPMGAEAFGVVVDKAKTGVAGDACFHMAWETLVQRLERTMRDRQETIMIIHDEGENDAIRKEGRKARRYLTAGRQYGGGHFTMSFPQLIDDPVPRNSQNSYLLQFADLVAYAAWRAYMKPSPGVALVAPGNMWNELGQARLGVVNSWRKPVAVVVRTY